MKPYLILWNLIQPKILYFTSGSKRGSPVKQSAPITEQAVEVQTAKRKTQRDLARRAGLKSTIVGGSPGLTTGKELLSGASN